MAEKFILEQGYSVEKLDLNDSSISYDIMEHFVSQKEDLIKLRHNLLEANASYSQKTEDGWFIGFKYYDKEKYKLSEKEAVGIFVSKDGKSIYKLHEHLIFNKK